MESKPLIYIVAGPNGIGKSTSAYSVLPINVPIINADDIAKQLRENMKDLNVQEQANAEAIQRMNVYLSKKESFGFETNLADNDTWVFFKACSAHWLRSDHSVLLYRCHRLMYQPGHESGE